jgi:hypothetical protein
MDMMMMMMFIIIIIIIIISCIAVSVLGSNLILWLLSSTLINEMN